MGLLLGAGALFSHRGVAVLVAGLRHVVTVPDAPYDGTRLAAALLMTTTTADRRAALSRVAVVASHRITPRQEATP